MKDICGTTGLACIRCNPGACEHRCYNAVHKMATKINKEANDLIFGTVKDIVTEAGIVHEYEINEKFIVMAISKQTAMEPIHEGRRYLCHTCMNPILYDDEIPNERDSYCPACGQKIDWEGVKE